MATKGEEFDFGEIKYKDEKINDAKVLNGEI